MPTAQPWILATVFIGALFLAASLWLSLRASRTIPARLRTKWLVMAALMAFFLLGYLFFLFIRVKAIPFPIETLTAAVFFGGSLFVLLMTSVTLQTLQQRKKDEIRITTANRELLDINRELKEEISLRREAQQQAAVRTRYLTSLHAIDTVISASLDLGVTLKVFLDQLDPHLQIDAAAVLLLNRHTQTLEFGAGRGFSSRAIEQSRERLGEGSAGRAALDRKMCHIADLGQAGDRFRRGQLLAAEQFVGYCAFPLIAKGEIQGVLELYHRRPFNPDQELSEFLQSLAVRAAIAIENATLFQNLQRTNAELILAYDTTIEGWGRALELRDQETSGHTERVVDMTRRLARACGVGEEKIVHMVRGALLHDIGKMAISDSILMKEGPLTDQEREIMQQHPQYAFEMLAPISYLQPALDIPYCHHERWDGSGYPRGLAGNQIPLAARIFAIADTWDALISHRRYHEAWDQQKVCDHIQSEAGSHFDPWVVEKFIELGECAPLQRADLSDRPGSCTL